MDNKWRFADNNYGRENGLDTSDMETFKKDPTAALAREIAQNSIDAAFGDKPVKLEFKLFEISRDGIPGISALGEEIRCTYESVENDNKDKKPLGVINSNISRETIKCLRISDYNTTGLIGVSTNKRNTLFCNLTKGSGVSVKTGTSGGSKGIGKFVAFVASMINTVFYSTVTVEGEEGYIGICKLRSRPIPNDPDLMTDGTGYYAEGERNAPIQGELILDNDFHRGHDEPGTDIFIIGFNDSEEWRNTIISKILESFMVAIYRDRLEVVIDDITLNSKSMGKIIYESGVLANRGKKERRGIEAQYELLTQDESKGVYSSDLTIGSNSVITVYVKQYSSKEIDRATKQCVMIRYPYMKICRTTGHSFLPYSSLCIINDNELNCRLRAIENPQHTDWELKRLDDDKLEKKKTKELKKEMDNSIDDYIEEVLKQSSAEKTDFEGAGEFLPTEVELGGDDAGSLLQDPNKDSVQVSPVKKVVPTTPKQGKLGNNAEGYDFDTGDQEGFGDGKIPSPGGQNSEPNPDSEHEPHDSDTNGGEGDTSMLRRVALSGMKYKFIVTDKNQGEYVVKFISAYDEDNCEMTIRQFGAAEDKYPVSIKSATVNGNECMVKEGKIVNFKLVAEEKYTVSCKVDVKTMFAGEVVMYAYR